jgi:O-antigen/teichoic acid export membrane protein
LSLKKFGREFVGYGFGMAITRSIGLFSLPLVTNFYSKGQVGLIELGLALASLLTPLVTLGVDTGLTYFYWHQTDEVRRGSYITSAIVLALFCSLLPFFLLPFIEPVLAKLYFKSDVSDFYALLLFGVVMQALFTLASKVIRIQRRVLVYNFLVALNSILFLAFLYFFLLRDVNIRLYFLSKLISFVVVLVVALFLIRRFLVFRPRLESVKELLGYSLPLVPFSITTSLIGLADKFAINYFLTIEDVGVFAVGAKIGMLVSLLISAFGMAYGPYVMSIKDAIGHRAVYSRLFSLYLFVMLGAVLVIAAFDDFFLGFLTAGKSDYGDSCKVIAPVALGLVVHSLVSQLGVGLNVTRNNRFFFYGSVLALILNGILNLVFVPLFGVLASAYASVASYLVVVGWVYRVSNKLYPVPYSMAGFCGVGIVFGLSFVLIQAYSSPVDVVVRFVCLFGYSVFAGVITYTTTRRG